MSSIKDHDRPLRALNGVLQPKPLSTRQVPDGVLIMIFGQNDKTSIKAKGYGAILVKLQEASVLLTSAATTKGEGRLNFTLSGCNSNLQQNVNMKAN